MVVSESRRRVGRRYGFAEEEPPGVADPKTVCSSRLSRVWRVTAKGYRRMETESRILKIRGLAMAQVKTGGTAERIEI